MAASCDKYHVPASTSTEGGVRVYSNLLVEENRNE